MDILREPLNYHHAMEVVHNRSRSLRLLVLARVSWESPHLLCMIHVQEARDTAPTISLKQSTLTRRDPSLTHSIRFL